jgi:hypothetical protein
MVWAFDDSRDLIIDVIGSMTDVETVDRYVYDRDSETVIMEVTSYWSSSVNQHDGAWAIYSGLRTAWEDKAEPLFFWPEWQPNFTLINSGRTYTCPGEFMVAMAARTEGRSAWEVECA